MAESRQGRIHEALRFRGWHMTSSHVRVDWRTLLDYAWGPLNPYRNLFQSVYPSAANTMSTSPSSRHEAFFLLLEADPVEDAYYCASHDAVLL